MSVVSVKLLRSGRSGGRDLTSRRYQRRFRVITDNVNDDESLVLSAGPQLGESHPSDIFATCKSLEADIEDDASDVRWILTAEYDRQPEPEQQETEDGNPLDLKWTMDGSSVDREIPTEVDALGNPVVDSAGQPLRDLTLPHADYTFSLSGNIAVLDLNQISSFRNKVNNAALFSALAETTRISRFAFQTKRHPEIGLYFPVTFEFAIREGGWDEELLDQGFYELDSSGNPKLIVIDALDENGNVVDQFTPPEPVPLDGTGHRDTNNPPTGATVPFQRFIAADFSALGIPTTFEELE